MDPIKAVGIRELKNRLSSYLKEVTAGTVILVLDRNRVIGELRRPTRVSVPLMAHPILDALIRQELVHPPGAERLPCPASPVRLPEATAQRLIDEDRE